MNRSAEALGSTDFKPPIYLRPALVQTALAGQKFRSRRTSSLEQGALDIIVPCQEGVRLRASYTPAPKPKGLVIFLHGWEGSQESSYVRSCAAMLLANGYSCFRLNYRDHGDSHFLNEGLFYAGRFTEVFDGVKYGASLAANLPVYLIGFSLGGNFALRILRAMKTDPIENMVEVFAISPVIDPLNASPVVDQNRWVQRYFRKKWARSLLKKQAFFPKLYDFDDVLNETTIMGMSELLISKHLSFQCLTDFFNAYRIWPDDLLDVHRSGHIIMAKHDPVLPANDVFTLNLPDSIRLVMLPYGGHNGFFQSFMGPSWYDNYILGRLTSIIS